MPGKCRARDLVYGVKATIQDNDVKRYQGQAVNFKNRHYKHKHALKYEDSQEATALSRLCWGGWGGWGGRGVGVVGLVWRKKRTFTPP